MKPSWTNRFAPSAEEIADLAHRAVAALPEPYRTIAMPLPILVDDLAAEDVLTDLGLENPYEVSGLYAGESLATRSVLDQAAGLDCIYLYRLPILDEWAERGNVTLGELVSHIVVHELAHHIGLSDDDIARIDRWWE